MATTGGEIARLLLSSAAMQSNLIVQNAAFKRQLFETQNQRARERIAQQQVVRQQKKEERKARKKKNATLAAVAVAAVVTGGAALAAAPAAAAGAAATGAGVGAAEGFLAGAGTGILGAGGAATQAALVSSFAPITAAGLAATPGLVGAGLGGAATGLGVTSAETFLAGAGTGILGSSGPATQAALVNSFAPVANIGLSATPGLVGAGIGGNSAAIGGSPGFFGSIGDVFTQGIPDYLKNFNFPGATRNLFGVFGLNALGNNLR